VGRWVAGLALSAVVCSRGGAPEVGPLPDAGSNPNVTSRRDAVDGSAGAVDSRSPSDLHPSVDGPWTVGTSGRLRIQATEAPRHDGSFGAARLELQALADHRLVLSKQLEGEWQILAYVPSARTFVIGGQFETGAWLPLDEIRYVDETIGAMRMSRYDGGTWIAFAAVPGPDGRFIVFVGQSRGDRAFEGGRFRLQVLDTIKDALYDLGRPPAPPPVNEDDASAFDPHVGWDWGAPVDGVVQMDPGIITFSDAHTIRVSYGADTIKRRAGRRRQRSWDLERTVATGRMIPPSAAEAPTGSAKSMRKE